ncbi:MAG: nicotinamide-nucleotide amidohydrolase family protein [Bacteriovoracaceae bacterium]
MKCALLIIGDEILSGRIQDKNIQWLAKYLFKVGHQLSSVEVCADEQKLIVEHLNKLTKTHEFVFVSGGLGPTADDVTKPSLAKFLNSPLKHSEKALQMVQAHYRRYDREFEDYKKMGNQYDLIPENVTPIENPVGLAPGLLATVENSSILCAPGVPSEYQAMIENSFSQLANANTEFKKHFTCRTKGIPEEKIFLELCPNLWDELSQFGTVSSYPQVGGIDIVVTFQGNKEDEIRNIFERSSLASHIWQFGEKPLELLIIELAKKLNKKIAVAESCTGGLVASKLTDVSGSSEVFLGGVVSYSNESKMKLLNVQEQTLKSYGAVSEATAKEMAKGVKELLGADLCVSTTGIAGPTGATPGKPVGTVFIGSCDETESAQNYKFSGNRNRLKTFFTQYALWQLLDLLKKCQ